MIGAAKLLIHVIGDDGESIERIHPHTTLKAASGIAPQQPAHLAFLDQVDGTLMDVGKTVDPGAVEVRAGSHDVLILRSVGQRVGLGNGQHRRPDDRIVHHIFDPLAEHVDNQIQPPQTFFILSRCHHRHDSSSLSHIFHVCGSLKSLSLDVQQTLVSIGPVTAKCQRRPSGFPESDMPVDYPGSSQGFRRSLTFVDTFPDHRIPLPATHTHCGQPVAGLGGFAEQPAHKCQQSWA